jgi:hypothetical protein
MQVFRHFHGCCLLWGVVFSAHTIGPDSNLDRSRRTVVRRDFSYRPHNTEVTFVYTSRTQPTKLVIQYRPNLGISSWNRNQQFQLHIVSVVTFIYPLTFRIALTFTHVTLFCFPSKQKPYVQGLLNDKGTATLLNFCFDVLGLTTKFWV